MSTRLNSRLVTAGNPSRLPMWLVLAPALWRSQTTRRCGKQKQVKRLTLDAPSAAGASVCGGQLSEIDESTGFPYNCMVQTVVETPAFLASANDEGVSPAERSEIVSYLADNPSAGDVISGTGGARKVRFAGRGKGKSGGYRVITFFAGKDMPLFLFDIYSKDSQANLSKAERNELRGILTELPKIWKENTRSRIAERKRR